MKAPKPEKIRQDFSAAPLPIQLSCRYSNGIVVSFGARALILEGSTLRILCSEDFEKSVKLKVQAPFLEGIWPCRVLASSRSSERSGYFEIDLKFLKKPKPKSRLEAAHAPIAKDVVQAARELAALLELSDTSSFSEALQALSQAHRSSLLGVTGAAIALLLQEKGLLDLKLLVESYHAKG